MKTAADLWFDEAGAVVTAELIFVTTILCCGMVVGMTAARDAVVTELADLAAAIGCLNQSYSWSGVLGNCVITAGSQFQDGLDAGDDACSQPAGQNSRGVVICTVGAVTEGQN